MTKADLVDLIAVDAEISKRLAGRIVDRILDEIKSALKHGERVTLTPFGSFVVRERKAREGRNPKTGAVMPIAARRVVAFVPGTALKGAVSGLRRRKA